MPIHIVELCVNEKICNRHLIFLEHFMRSYDRTRIYFKFVFIFRNIKKKEQKKNVIWTFLALTGPRKKAESKEKL